MGCGSSSLKGEAVNVDAEASMAAPRRVNTNFASVDYDQEANKGRRMTEYAPHETIKAKKSHDVPRLPGEGGEGRSGPAHLKADGVPDQDPAIAKSAGTSFPHETSTRTEAGDGVELKPYTTIGDDSWDADENRNRPTNGTTHNASAHVNGTQDGDPTSNTAKSQFASANDPASAGNQQARHEPNSTDPSTPAGAGAASELTPGEEDAERKKTWLGDKYSKYHATKHGKNVVLSDEELKKYTGKDRQELDDWAKTQNVGPNQAAGRYNSDNGFGAGASWTT